MTKSLEVIAVWLPVATLSSLMPLDFVKGNLDLFRNFGHRRVRDLLLTSYY